MIRNNLSSLYGMPRSSKTLSKINLSSAFRASLLKGGLPKNIKSYQGRSGLFNNSRRNFNEKIDRLLENGISKIPNGNLGYVFVGLNTFFYGLYLMWPRDRMYSFLNNFTFSNYNLSKGRLHTLFTCHFSHMGFFAYAIDSVILYLFCNNLQMMFGSLYTAKLAILGMVCGSLLLMLQH
jgi:membrane associated rhomboid family serine protease